MARGIVAKHHHRVGALVQQSISHAGQRPLLVAARVDGDQAVLASVVSGQRQAGLPPQQRGGDFTAAGHRAAMKAKALDVVAAQALCFGL